MLEIVFITTNKAKLAHARYLCRNYTVRVVQQKHYGVGYDEPRTLDRDQLLQASLIDAVARWKKNVSNPEDKFFFFEDTSVVINSLSSEGEYPGTDIKYWMQGRDFESVDKELLDAGGDRSVVVRSDVVLVLPKKIQISLGKEYVRFVSSIQGEIARTDQKIITQPLYPWLDSKTFNKWFVPEGCDLPLSMLPIEQADKHDFRRGAFEGMLAFLYEHNLIKQRSKRELHHARQAGMSFLPPLFLICGPTCAGKTTIAEYLANTYGYYHIEASDYMYLSYYERLGVGSEVKIGDFAENALKDDPLIVVDRVFEKLRRLELTPVVITGFRTKYEVEGFQNYYDGDMEVVPVFVDAAQPIRCERYLARNRLDSRPTKASFLRIDRQQGAMGVWELRKYLRGHVFRNEASLVKYISNFKRAFLAGKIGLDKDESVGGYKGKPERLEEEIIIALAESPDSGKYYTTAEVAKLINKRFGYNIKPKSKNNVSRYFNQYFREFYEIEFIEGKRRYKLSHTGVSEYRYLCLGNRAKKHASEFTNNS